MRLRRPGYADVAATLALVCDSAAPPTSSPPVARLGRPRSRSRTAPCLQFVDVTVEHKPPRNKRFGVRRKHWEAAINCGTFFSLWVSPMAKPKLDALVAALEAA
jgi:hypothetical protein